jgi:Tol biopolymer transport system component
VRPFAARDGSIVFEQQTFDSDVYLLGDSGARAFARSTQWEDEPRWSPDGRRVAFLSARSGTPQLWIADRDGKNASQLTRFKNASLRSPRWSPDGGSIAFAVGRENSSSLWKVSAATAQLSQITSGDATDVSPAWSRDGRIIYFTSKRKDSWAIWSVPSGGGSPARVADFAAGAIFEGGDGSLYFSRPHPGGIWRLTPSRDAAVPVVERFSEDAHANWELVGDSLWYLDPQAKSLVMLDVGTGRERRGPILLMSDDDIGVSVNLREEVLYAAANRAESDLVVVRTLR